MNRDSKTIMGQLKSEAIDPGSAADALPCSAETFFKSRAAWSGCFISANAVAASQRASALNSG